MFPLPLNPSGVKSVLRLYPEVFSPEEILNSFLFTSLTSVTRLNGCRNPFSPAGLIL
ncbi:MAG: hypothetical protein IPJ45_02130 [Ignavibacteria bacterium]|nr:hypothetical protein [Ignavibacteria bacterium]